VYFTSIYLVLRAVTHIVTHTEELVLIFGVEHSTVAAMSYMQPWLTGEELWVFICLGRQTLMFVFANAESNPNTSKRLLPFMCTLTPKN
jgi:hypothetical protein